MHEQDMAILKSLVAVAWADGHFAAEEREQLAVGDTANIAARLESATRRAPSPPKSRSMST